MFEKSARIFCHNNFVNFGDTDRTIERKKNENQQSLKLGRPSADLTDWFKSGPAMTVAQRYFFDLYILAAG